MDLTRLFFRLSLWMVGANIIILTPQEGQYDGDFDALILSGGSDIEPSRYGEPLDHLVEYDVARDNFEFAMLDMALSKKKPVLGICRGMQLMNIHCGGTLFTDLKKVFDQLYLPQSFWAKAFYRKTIHAKGQSFLNTQKEDEILRVNSIHHQSIKDLGEGLSVVARDDHDIVQAIENKKDKIYGVQWHPEYMPFSHNQRQIFKKFVQNL